MSVNLNSNLDVLFNKMENFVSSKTVVGEAIIIGDVTLLPLIDVSVVVGSGAGEGKANGGGGGGGLMSKILPSAVIVVQKDNVSLINIKNQDSINKVIDMVPGVINNLGFKNLFQKDDDKKETEETKIEIEED